MGSLAWEFLGHLVDSSGIHPLPEKVRAISDYPQPQSRRQLRTFLGLVNFYHRFIPGCARILQPLNDLLSAAHGRSSTVLWDDVTTTAFSQIKEALASATLLAHPKPEALTNIMTDAADSAVGAILQQFIDGQWQPLSFFSRKLQPAEKRYSTFDRELLAVYLAISLLPRRIDISCLY